MALSDIQLQALARDAIQRAARDAHAVANHAANAFDTNGMVYARFALGLPPEPRHR